MPRHQRAEAVVHRVIGEFQFRAVRQYEHAFAIETRLDSVSDVARPAAVKSRSDFERPDLRRPSLPASLAAATATTGAIPMYLISSLRHRYHTWLPVRRINWPCLDAVCEEGRAVLARTTVHTHSQYSADLVDGFAVALASGALDQQSALRGFNDNVKGRMGMLNGGFLPSNT